MTIKELENALDAIDREYFGFIYETNDKCKAEGRMIEKDFEDGYGVRLKEKWNEEEKKQFEKLSDKKWAAFRALEAAEKAEREAKIAARKIKKEQKKS